MIRRLRAILFLLAALTAQGLLSPQPARSAEAKATATATIHIAPATTPATAALATAPSTAAPGAPALAYPTTRRDDTVDDYHGTKVADPYRWLEDADSPETREWITAENAVTFRFLEAIPQREKIRDRLTALWNYPRYGIPSREGDWYIFTKNEGLQNQSVVYKQRTLDEEPSVLLDPNLLSPDGTVALSTKDRDGVVQSFSFDGRYLAYGISKAGSDWIEIRVRETESGRDLTDVIQYVKFANAAWTHDHRGFYYARYPKPEGNALTSMNRNHKVYYHRLGTDQSADRLILELPDHPDWGFGPEVTEDGRYLILHISQGTDRRNRIYYMDLEKPGEPRLDGPIVRLLDDFDARYEFVGNDERAFYFKTDLDAPLGRLIAIDTQYPSRRAWSTIIPQSKGVLERISFVHDQFIATYLHDAHSLVRIYTTTGDLLREVELPALGKASGFNGRRSDSETFYSFTSFLYPTTTFRYDLKSGTSTVVQAPQVDFDPSAYETEQVFYASKDGTRVPMFLTHRKGIARDGNNPTLLYGYGGFNVPMTPSFSTSNLIWLEMGGIYAVANLRGGSEYGESWHAAGMLDKKQNVFDDFIAGAEYLIREGYTSPKRLAITGTSNGGLLVGAAMTQRPDLFAAVVPVVGVLDMLRFDKYTIGWAWTSDYGTASDPNGFQYLSAYSPLHNLRPGTKYPATLILTGDHDDRVVPAHSFKFAAALQAAQEGSAPVLIRIATDTGHGAGKPTSKLIEEETDKWAFISKTLGMAVAPAPAGGGSTESGRTLQWRR